MRCLPTSSTSPRLYVEYIFEQRMKAVRTPINAPPVRSLGHDQTHPGRAEVRREHYVDAGCRHHQVLRLRIVHFPATKRWVGEERGRNNNFTSRDCNGNRGGVRVLFGTCHPPPLPPNKTEKSNKITRLVAATTSARKLHPLLYHSVLPDMYLPLLFLIPNDAPCRCVQAMLGTAVDLSE